jgi:VanZ family protein
MRFIRGYWKSIVVCIGILYVSLVRDPGIHLPTFVGADKWVHLLMYALLGAVATYDSIRIQLSGWRLWLVATLLPILFGGIIELVQEQWFAPRSGEWIDWLADGIGVIIGTIAILIINRLYHRQHA